MSKQHPLVSSEVRQGERTTSIWHLKGWDTENDATFKQLIFHSNCFVDVDLREGVPNARFRFYLQEHKAPPKLSDTFSRRFRNSESSPLYLDLYVDYSSNKELDQNRIVLCDFSAALVNAEFMRLADENGGVSCNVPNKEMKTAERETTAKILLKEKFMLAREKTKFEPPSEIRLRISVTPTYIHYETRLVDNVQEDEDKAPPPEPIERAMTVKKNSTHLKLETKDGVILEADKFLLSGKSPFLKVEIEKQSKKLEFDGTVKLPHVDGKPMRCLLHWMQTGELHEDVGQCMDQLVEAAVKFELPELVNILEKKMIDLCTPENMYQLQNCAEKHGLTQAGADIANFIEEQKHLQMYS